MEKVDFIIVIVAFLCRLLEKAYLKSKHKQQIDDISAVAGTAIRRIKDVKDLYDVQSRLAVSDVLPPDLYTVAKVQESKLKDEIFNRNTE